MPATERATGTKKDKHATRQGRATMQRTMRSGGFAARERAFKAVARFEAFHDWTHRERMHINMRKRDADVAVWLRVAVLAEPVKLPVLTG